MLHLWSQLSGRHRRWIVRLLSICGCVLWGGAVLLILLVGDARTSQAQEPVEAIGTPLIDPVQITPIRPGQTPEPAQPTTAPSPAPTQQPPTPESTLPPAPPSIAPTAPVAEPPAPPSAPPAPVAPPAIAPAEPLPATPLPAPTDAPLAASPTRPAAQVRTRVGSATPASSPTRERASTTEPVIDSVAPSPQPRSTNASAVPSKAVAVTPTPAAVAALLDIPAPIDAVPAVPPASIVEAPEAALPPPSLETANIVYASGLRRIDARRYVVSACIANVGLGREADLEINVRIRSPGSRVVEVRSDRAAVSITGAEAQIRPEPLDASGARQIDVLVESDAALTVRDIAVSATQARWLAGRVRLVCEPGPASALVAPPRFLVDGADVRIDQAAQLLRVSAQSSVAAEAFWVVGAAGWSSLMLAAGAVLLACGLALWLAERLWL